MNFASPHLTSFLSRHCPTDPDLDLFNSSRLVDQTPHCFHALIHTTEWQQIINLATASRFAQVSPGFVYCLKVGSDCIAMCCRSWAGQCWASAASSLSSIDCVSLLWCVHRRARSAEPHSVSPTSCCCHLFTHSFTSIVIRSCFFGLFSQSEL